MKATFDNHPEFQKKTSLFKKGTVQLPRNPHTEPSRGNRPLSVARALHASTARQPEIENRLKRASNLLTELKSVVAEGVQLGEIDPRCLAQIEQINEVLSSRGEEVESVRGSVAETELHATEPQQNLAVGWLNPYTKKKTRKDGTIYEVPRRSNRGDPLKHPEDWYWNYQWREGNKVRSVYVAREKLTRVRSAIASNQTPESILLEIKGGNK